VATGWGAPRRRASLGPAGLDEGLEPLQVGLDPPADDAELVAGGLHDALRLEVHLQHDPGPAGVEPVEGDHPGLLRPVHGRPGDPLVRVLLGDLGLELPVDPADRGHPVRGRRRRLVDPVHAVHELGERLELGPLVVRGAHRDVDLDRLLDDAHDQPLAFSIVAWVFRACPLGGAANGRLPPLRPGYRTGT
jgi:hypothetical protein